ncbi:MAG: AAA family ATPase [Pseudomonadota bacterium]
MAAPGPEGCPLDPEKLNLNNGLHIGHRCTGFDMCDRFQPTRAALLTLLHDPRHRGLICFEEPENGVHPARVKQLVLLTKTETRRLTLSERAW